MGRLLDPQRYYWETFSTLKRDQIYLSLQLTRLDHIERCLNIFAAVSASTAIAGWTIWQHAAYVWGAVIALSQVYTATKNHLPFGVQLKSLNALYPEIEALTLSAERGWFRVARGEMTEEEIIDGASKLKETKALLTQKHLKSVILPENKKKVDEANEKAIGYLNNFLEG